MNQSIDTLNGIDMENGLSISMASVLPPPTSVPLSLGPPTRTVFQTSNIPTRKGAVTSTGTHNEVTVNGLKPASKDCISNRSWQTYKARPATNTKVKPVLEGKVSPKHGTGSHNSLGRDKRKQFRKGHPHIQTKNVIQLD